ncbi:MAG: tRNA lysidine(34) synthetase TilS, partial [Nitrospira sp.]|nr:tRNA lysidine(34) synthetase TilS [Nitrospira sp.]
MNRLFDEVHSFIRTNELFAKGESILVAFSGGPDSMFLADALRGISRTYRYGWDIRLAHLNHRISERADENEEFCRKAAADYLELPLIINSADIPAMKASGKYGGISIEHLGRRERYRMFVRVCREFDIAKLATGHQLDDQAETVLMRATAGSWLTGLAGIPVRRPLAPNMQTEVVRPLLRIERKQIDEYVKTENVPVFIDPTNQDLGYKRNRVRNDLMPLLRREFNPAAARHLAAIGFQAQELEVDLQRLASGFVSAPTHNAGRTSVRVEIGRLAEQGPLAQRYILRAALLAVGMPPRE